MNNMDLRGKVALVNGGARDIGRCTSVRLAQCGAKVVFSYPPFEDPKFAEETVQQIQANGGTAFAVPCDVMKPADIEAFVIKARESVGPAIDILVNVAGGLVARKGVAEMDEAFWDFVIDLNLKSTFLMTKAVLPFMPDGAAIVNFASQAGRDGGGPGSLAYATAKGGIMTFTRGLAKELGMRKIRVNAVCPGMINTTFHNTFTKPEVRVKVAAATPLGREGDPCEVANLVAYLVSPESSFLNGTNIDVNGGLFFS
ncbi:MAG TPA: SDR family oxidoreductase [Terriglobales bacterium]|nr:SDR family oxidoreductase [Terriglobales bacterium]